MDKIYLKDNYIVTELSGVTAVFPKNYSSYSENASGFYINSTFPVNNQRTVFIDFTRVTSIYNEAGTVAYTIGTLRSYLLTNTGFKSPSGGSGGVWGSITGTLSDQTDLQTALNAKQNTLISGTNIKTINGTSLLGSGDITVGGGITVGTTAVTSGTDGRVFFQAGGVVQQDSAFFWDNTNKRLGIGATPSTSVRLDVRAQGALSTDIAFRVRNSADTQNSFQIDGLGQGRIKSTGFTPRFAVGYDWFGSDRNAFVFTQNIQNFRGQEWTFDAGYNGVFEGLRIFNDLTGNNQGLFTIQLNNYCFGTQMLNNDTGTAERRVLRIANGVAPTTSKADEFKFYSADRGGTAGKASAHFRCEDGTINVLGDLSGFGTSSPAARLDVRAQGALSTDIAFRVRNSADTLNFAQFNGDGTYFISSGGSATDNAFSRFSDGRMFMAKSGANFIELNATTGQNRFFFSSNGVEINVGTRELTIQGSTCAVRFGQNNLQINTGAQVGSGTNAIMIQNGTSPSSTPLDHFYLYSADIVAGNAAPHFRTENGSIIKLFRGAALTASDGTLANAVTRIAELEARLQAHGLIA